MANLTNEEVYQQIATMSETDAAQYGVTPAIRSTAQQPDAVRAAAFSAPYTPLYNGFVGMIAKFAVTALSKAKYSDIYARHHRTLCRVDRRSDSLNGQQREPETNLPCFPPHPLSAVLQV